MKNTTIFTILLLFILLTALNISAGACTPSARNIVSLAYIGEPDTIDVLASDTTICDEYAVINLISGPHWGTAFVMADNSISYTSNAGYVGYDTIWYKLTNPDGDTADAMVTIEVIPSASSCPGVATINGLHSYSPGYRTVFCQGEVVLLKYARSLGGVCNECDSNSYTKWSNGVNRDSITVTSTGSYIATLYQDSAAAVTCGYHYQGGIISIDTFNIAVLPTQLIANPGASRTLPGCGKDTLGGMPTANGGTPPYTYLWVPDSGMVGGSHDAQTSNPVIYALSNPGNYPGITTQITYTLTLKDSNGCVDSGRITITPLLTSPLQPPVAAISECELSTPSDTRFTYQWYHNYIPVIGATSSAYPEDSSGNWYVMATPIAYPECPHLQSSIINVQPYNRQEICIVTLDSTNTYNLIVWDNPASQDIASFRIYKLSDSTSQYVLLGEQPYNQFSTYLDTTSNPSQLSATYGITIKDSCNNESNLSPTHTTILLSSNQGINHTVNLSWNAYQGFTYNNFEIWRSANGGPMTQLTTVANSTLAYVDNSPPAQAYYQIRVTNPNGCNPARSAFDYSTVRSNIVNNTSTGIQNINSLVQDLILYPNPSAGLVNVKLNGTYNGQASLHVTDMLGRIVKEEPVEIKTGANMNIILISIGTYFIEVVTADGQVQKGIVTIQ